MARLSLVPTAWRSQAASGCIFRTIAVWTSGAMVKPLSGAILAAAEFWAEVETARPHRKVAARVRVSTILLSLGVGESWVELLLISVLLFVVFILILLVIFYVNLLRIDRASVSVTAKAPHLM